MKSEALRLIIRSKLADSCLPQRIELQFWGVPGTGESCTACAEVIRKEQFVIQGIAVDEPKRAVQLHAACFHAWQAELAAFKPGAPARRTVPDRVRDALRDGTLTRVEGVRTWVGYGTEHPCHVCGEVIR